MHEIHTTKDWQIQRGKYYKVINIQPNPIPTWLCHVIYCCGDKSYPCLVGIRWNKVNEIDANFHQSNGKFNNFGDKKRRGGGPGT